MSTKWIPWSFAILFGLAAIYLAITVLDSAISLDHSRSEQQRQRERSDLAITLLRERLVGEPEASLASTIVAAEKNGAIVKTTPGVEVQIDEISIRIIGGRVASVEYFD